MSTIYLETKGGLANRMRLLASGLWLKDVVASRVIGFWEENEALNCPFHLLFENIDGLEMMPKNRKFRFVTSSNNLTFFKKQKAYWVNKLVGIDYCIEEQDFGRLIWPGKLDIAEVKKERERMYFKTFEEFGENTTQFKKFKPAKPLLTIIDKVTANFSERTIGVHIRRTDNSGAIENSPTALFISTMQKEIEKDSTVSFFLCTDDLDVENQLIDLFGRYIITYPKELSRQTQKGIQDAVVDMFCLSSTKKIYGSYWSSFSEIAARVKGTELKCLIK